MAQRTLSRALRAIGRLSSLCFCIQPWFRHHCVACPGSQWYLLLGGLLNLTASKSINRFSNTRLDICLSRILFPVPSFSITATCSYWRMSQLFCRPAEAVISYVGGERSIHISYISSKLGGHLQLSCY